METTAELYYRLSPQKANTAYDVSLLELDKDKKGSENDTGESQKVESQSLLEKSKDEDIFLTSDAQKQYYSSEHDSTDNSTEGSEEEFKNSTPIEKFNMELRDRNEIQAPDLLGELATSSQINRILPLSNDG